MVSSMSSPAPREKSIGSSVTKGAGFIYGLIQEWDIEKSFDFASWAAAMASLKLGGRAGIPALKSWRHTT